MNRKRAWAIASDRRRQRKHVNRAGVVPASMAGRPVQHVAEKTGVSRPMAGRWQQRFAEAGVNGLLRDKARKPGNGGARGDAELRCLPDEATLDRPGDGNGRR